MALAATVLLVLMVATVAVLPITLPLVIEGLAVDTGPRLPSPTRSTADPRGRAHEP